MPRPQKQTVDFFPHYCNHGKTIFILEQKYGLKGYCLWFKLLEEIGSHNGHFLDFNDNSYVLFFSAKTMVSVTEILELMDLLSELNAIDKELWKNKIVWCQNFVDNLSQVYDKRVVSAPEKPVSVTEMGVSGVGNPQSKVKESKVKYMADKSAGYLLNDKPISMEELTYEYEGSGKTPKKYSNKRKLYSRIAIYYMELQGETGNVLRYFKDIKELVDIAESQYPDFDEKKIESEIKGRINKWRDDQLKKDLSWGLSGVITHWNRILKS